MNIQFKTLATFDFSETENVINDIYYLDRFHSLFIRLDNGELQAKFPRKMNMTYDVIYNKQREIVLVGYMIEM
jgi:hypothetical protein